MNRSYLLTFLLTFLIGCASSVVKVDSEPKQASVYLKDGPRLKKLGETPMNLRSGEFDSLKSFQLRIEKEGFQPQEMLVDNRGLSVQADIHATLLPEVKAGKTEASADGSQALIQSMSLYQANQHRGLASIQSHLATKEYLQAELQAKQFVTENPYSSVGWALLGNSYFLQNKVEMAIEAYRKSLSYDPENVDTKKVLDYLGRTSPVRNR